jgi:hypothetical protein
MGRTYVAKAESGRGWRIWERKMKKWWGNYFKIYPEELLEELNGLRRPEKIVELTRRYQKK